MGSPGWRLADAPALRRWGTVTLQAAKTALAAGSSWFVASDLLGNAVPVFAPLAALLTVQVTIWESVSRGMQRVLGVVAGVVVAYGFARLAGISAWSIGLVVMVSFLAGRALRLGAQGSVQVPISALLVLVLGATTGGYAVDRVLDTAVGAACGIAVNLLIVPRSHVPQALAGVKACSDHLAALLRGSADHVARLPGAVPTPPATGLLASARLIGAELDRAALGVRQARTALRWSPHAGRDRPAVERLLAAVITLRMVERQARGIARALADGHGPWATAEAEVARELAGLLTLCSSSLGRWGASLAAEVSTGTVGGNGRQAPAAAPAGAIGADDEGHDGALRAEEAYQAVVRASRGAAVSLEVAAAGAAMAVDARRIALEVATTPAPSPLPSARLRDLFAP